MNTGTALDSSLLSVSSYHYRQAPKCIVIYNLHVLLTMLRCAVEEASLRCLKLKKLQFNNYCQFFFL